MDDAACGFQTALTRFLRRCDADSTRVAYGRELVRFLAWWDGVPPQDLLFDYRDHLREKGLGPTTVRWRTTVVRAFLAFAEREGYVAGSAVGDFKPPRGTTGFVPRVLSRRELDELLAAPDRRKRRGKRDALILACLGVGGLRAGEVCRLDREDVRFTENEIVLRVTGKRRKERLVSLPWAWVDPFRGYLKHWPGCDDGPLFFCGQPGHESRRLTVAAVDYLVRTSAAAIGLTEISPHALRHTMASLAIEAGEPLHRVRDRLGHSSVFVTSRYLHVAGQGAD